MQKLTFATALLFLFALPSFSQNFDPEPSAVQDKLENALKRYGTIERVYLNDNEKKTFEAKPGKEYYAWVVYKKSSTVVRRMMIIQLGSQGEKVKINYPKFNQAITDADNQAFFISVVAPEDTNTPTVLYRVDASPESTVYIYEATRGFKRD
jgi:hypothetical protein